MTETVQEVNQSVSQTAIFHVDAVLLRDTFKYLKNVKEEATFDLTSEGLFCRMMDPSHVFMVDAVISNEVLYGLTVPENRRFCLNLKELLPLLKGVKKETVATVKITATDAIFDIAGENFSQTLLMPETTAMPNPKLTFDAEFVLERKPLYDAVKKKVEAMGEAVCLESSDVALTLTSRNWDGEQKYSRTFNRNSPEVLEFQTRLATIIDYESDGKTVKRTYSAYPKTLYGSKFLRDLLSFPAGKIGLKYAHERPLQIDFDEKLKATAYLAPRLE